MSLLWPTLNARMRRMARKIISIRCPKEMLETAQKICEINEIDLSSYLVLAASHYVHAKALRGEIDMPEHFLKTPYKRGRKFKKIRKQ